MLLTSSQKQGKISKMSELLYIPFDVRNTTGIRTTVKEVYFAVFSVESGIWNGRSFPGKNKSSQNSRVLIV